jgi:U1 small nuclear ribonucleoprotein 70kDa
MLQMGQIHPTGLTPNLLKLFEPRPPLEYKLPLEKRKLPAYTGVFRAIGDFFSFFFISCKEIFGWQV